MLHRIRLAMQTGTFDKLSGDVEVDETYIGGKARNMHKRSPHSEDQGNWSGQDRRVGMVQRDGVVRARSPPGHQAATVQGRVRKQSSPGPRSTQMHGRPTAVSGATYDHRTVDHAETYVNGQVHTNRMENFWALLKRGLHGTYISVEPFHLFRYLDERVFTFNLRDKTTSVASKRSWGWSPAAGSPMPN